MRRPRRYHAGPLHHGSGDQRGKRLPLLVGVLALGMGLFGAAVPAMPVVAVAAQTNQLPVSADVDLNEAPALSLPPVDTTPPVITPHVDCTFSGNAPWCRGTLTLSWDISDPESAPTVISGQCDGANLTTDTGPNGRTFTCIASSEGGTSQQSVTLYRDATQPQISLSNFGGRPPAAVASVTDPSSGIASITCTDSLGTPPVFTRTFTTPPASGSLALSVPTQGLHQFVCTAMDVAGNTSLPAFETAFTTGTRFVAQQTPPLTFGFVPPMTCVNRTIVFANNGTSVFSINVLAPDGVNANDFSVVAGSGPATIQPGQARLITIAFCPSGALAPTAVLKIMGTQGVSTPWPVIIPLEGSADCVGDAAGDWSKAIGKEPLAGCGR